MLHFGQYGIRCNSKKQVDIESEKLRDILEKSFVFVTYLLENVFFDFVCLDFVFAHSAGGCGKGAMTLDCPLDPSNLQRGNEGVKIVN